MGCREQRKGVCVLVEGKEPNEPVAEEAIGVRKELPRDKNDGSDAGDQASCLDGDLAWAQVGEIVGRGNNIHGDGGTQDGHGQQESRKKADERAEVLCVREIDR